MNSHAGLDQLNENNLFGRLLAFEPRSAPRKQASSNATIAGGLSVSIDWDSDAPDDPDAPSDVRYSRTELETMFEHSIYFFRSTKGRPSFWYYLQFQDNHGSSSTFVRGRFQIVCAEGGVFLELRSTAQYVWIDGGGLGYDDTTRRRTRRAPLLEGRHALVVHRLDDDGIEFDFACDAGRFREAPKGWVNNPREDVLQAMRDVRVSLRDWQPEVQQVVSRLRNKGETVEQIAARTGLTPAAIDAIAPAPVPAKP